MTTPGTRDPMAWLRAHPQAGVAGVAGVGVVILAVRSKKKGSTSSTATVVPYAPATAGPNGQFPAYDSTASDVYGALQSELEAFMNQYASAQQNALNPNNQPPGSTAQGTKTSSAATIAPVKPPELTDLFTKSGAYVGTTPSPGPNAGGAGYVYIPNASGAYGANPVTGITPPPGANPVTGGVPAGFNPNIPYLEQLNGVKP